MKAKSPSSSKPPPELASLCAALGDHSPLPMAAVTESNHVVRYVNPAFRRLMERDEKALVGRPFCELLPESDPCVPLLDRVLRTGRSEVHAEQRNPAHGLFSALAAWPVVVAGRTVGVVVQLFEDTQLHANSLAMNQALILSSVRQHELTEAADEASSRVREADVRKDAFLATLAHELRNPLAPIRTMLEVLRRGGDGERIDPALSTIERQVGQMTRLIDDLLDVSRISQDKLLLRRKEVDLADVVRQVVDAYRSVFDVAQQELTVTLPETPAYLHADPVRLTQIIGNLLHNASKFTGQGGRISLSVERQGGEVVVIVRDSGIGISPDMLPKIFEMFRQADQSLERSQGGLGIGLTLVRRLVEMHGGSVAASSAGIERGSEFVVRLPELIREESSPSPVPIAAEPPPAAPRRILVVDDNRDAAEALSMMLKLAGHETHLAFDGAEALEAAARLRPDVLLLDIGMPKLSGYDVARRIREQPWGQTMLLVALTGWGQDEDRRKTREAGFDGHLVKPVEFTTLARMLAVLPTAQRAR